ncbi:mechanosensitive ion channel family protein [Deinococcus metallilatus]|uniref:Mechanosensitive ion channel family protein n=1 Tax=Deinococcus metallilatus TaxID=1211322 RepID=A0AAJ5JZP5_9DEIO|nr:mechanosensitive ion channel family protein [Deinococcus metallilatus]MBB5295916.1 small conductance mechanosensitive channel [Deinococcus metallilatus]QBY08250.1 mechanosensitive ion channel family protein [Deinococcus metallilatus]RXJ11981.1 mechanosensitive ion channel family protein [Deinococcus metallilatus]TLK25787.1 mechanosensitive ion channel family protein [Deinococcus metallilatus]GMA14550.1 mechanosensitive ion channel protein MscS [Deinococcus metallilatus]
MTGQVDSSRLLGLDALRAALAETWQGVRDVVAEYGPNALLAALLVLLYALLFWGVSRVAFALLGRFFHVDTHPIARRVLRTVLRLTFLMLVLLSITALFPALAHWSGAVFRVYLLLLLLYVGWGVIQRFLHVQTEHWELDTSLRVLVSNVTRAVWVLLGVYLVAAQFGVNLLPILGGLGVVGLAVGFAAQDILANLISGITLLLDRPFRLGDWIRTEAHEGQVTRLTLRTTRIRTRDNEHVSIPNKEVAGAVVENLSKGGTLRLNVNVPLAYREHVDHARQLLLKVLRGVSEVLPDPAPQVLVQELEESRVRLLLRFWIGAEHVVTYPVIRMQVLEAAKEALQAAGVEVPFPRMQVQLDGVPSAVSPEPREDRADA